MARKYSEQPKASMMPGVVFHSLAALTAVAQTAEIIAVSLRDVTEHGANVLELNLVRMQMDLVAQMAEAGHSIPEEYQHLIKS
jgi:hypothetical protein